MDAFVNLHWLTCGGALVTVAAAVAGGWLARGSTAVPAAAWAALAALALAAEACAVATGGLVDPAARSAVRLVVAALAVCPTMALLGAKRPQHGVWQFIVATLACVLALPAMSALLVRPGNLPDVHMIVRFFLPLLVLVGWMNFAATRHGLAAALVAGGQLLLVAGFLPGVGQGEPLGAEIDAAGAGLLAAGAVLAAVQSAVWPATRLQRQGLAAVTDRPLLAIRETLGAAWTLRIAERFNAVAGERGWPCRLGFSGLVVDPAAGRGDWEADSVRCLRALLRRFATEAWIERHGGFQAEA
jgi:hypothetical protein